jgi:geranylgeranyl pyrophosphate synthase
LKTIPGLALVSQDLAQVERKMREAPHADIEPLATALDTILNSGGKRVRPALALLANRFYHPPTEKVICLAAAVEMLHTATLVHDDLIDGSLIRRGVETLNASWTPAATILTGDYVFARAAHLVARTENVRLTQRFAETLMVICNGEIRQMFNGTAIRNALEDYEQRIYAKTASLIALSAEAGAILGDVPGGEERALRTYGKRIGTAFQIVDDVLDFVADEEKLGKPVGSDLRQGLATLPVLLYLEARPGASAVRQVLDGDRSDSTVEEAVQAVIASPAIEEALTAARQHADRAKEALQHFASSTYRTALLDLADFTVDRRF